MIFVTLVLSIDGWLQFAKLLRGHVLQLPRCTAAPIGTTPIAIILKLAGWISKVDRICSDVGVKVRIATLKPDRVL
jgi:hypothetical protein